MELYFVSFCSILGVAGCMAVAGCKVWQKKRARDDNRRRRTLNNLRAALMG
jgi:hypothetical protein